MSNFGPRMATGHVDRRNVRRAWVSRQTQRIRPRWAQIRFHAPILRERPYL